MGNYIRTLTVYFDTAISQQEIPLFRRAVLKSMGGKADVLYHNHTGARTFRYAYPLVQYKRIHGKAAIVYIGKATEMVSDFFISSNFVYKTHLAEKKLMVESVVTEDLPIGINGGINAYRLLNWLPFNSNNYNHYLQMDNVADRVAMLNRILVANIISLMKGMNIFVENQIEATIVDLIRHHIIIYKGVALMAFDIAFKSNVTLPLHLGLGKNTSVGCGVMCEFDKQ